MIDCICGKCRKAFTAEPEGGHRLMCGDSTKPEDVATLAGDRLARMVFTSPPYAQQRAYTTGGISDWDELMRGVFAALPVVEDAQILVNLGMVHRDNEWLPYWDGWIEWMRGIGYRRFGLYVWDQGAGLMGNWNGRLAPSFELIFHFTRTPTVVRKTVPKKPENVRRVSDNHGGMRGADGKVGGWSNPMASLAPNKVPDSVIRVTRGTGNLGAAGNHPAVSAVGVAAQLMDAFSQPAETTYEPFGGSGTTIIAGEQNGRFVIAMELAPQYCDVAVRRWQNFTRKTAIRARDGRSFDSLGAAP